MSKNIELPIPPHFDPERVDKVWKVEYQKLADYSSGWRTEHGIKPFYDDEYRTCLILVDVQNTFCTPGFELFVGGRSGKAAVEDNKRLCSFIYRNLNRITHIMSTMDTHQLIQIFHSIFFIDDDGNNPGPLTIIKQEDIKNGRWKLNQEIVSALGYSADYLRGYIRHYTGELSSESKYDLMIWPYHAMLGGIGHALVSSVEESLVFHALCRFNQTEFQIKGDNPVTEHYSALRPEVTEDQNFKPLITREEGVFRTPLTAESIYEKIRNYDLIIIAGQAKSHCVSWTIDDIIKYVPDKEKELLKKIYVLEDCTSPVVVPDVVDYTQESEKAFSRFSDAGINIVDSKKRIDQW